MVHNANPSLPDSDEGAADARSPVRLRRQRSYEEAAMEMAVRPETYRIVITM